jgi:hypothetical protein
MSKIGFSATWRYSDFVKSARYDYDSGDMEVVLNVNGKVKIYRYFDVPLNIWKEFADQNKPGRFYNNKIKNKFDFKMEEQKSELKNIQSLNEYAAELNEERKLLSDTDLRKIAWGDVEYGGIDYRDAQDFTDVYIETANFVAGYKGGRDLTEDELDELTDRRSYWDDRFRESLQ